MHFTSPSWAPPLPEIPDSISIDRFILDENYGRHPFHSARTPFTCALSRSGRTPSALDMKQRVDYLSRALCKEFNLEPSACEWDKVIGCFSLNSIDYLALAWAVHRIGGIVTCINPTSTAEELEYQMRDSGAKAIFTCLPLLPTVRKLKMANERICILPLPKQVAQGQDHGHKTVEELVELGSRLGESSSSDKSWTRGEGKRRCAFVCYSSGTSGLSKGVMISHYNVIANTLQIVTHDMPTRKRLQRANGPDYTEAVLGLLPMSHIYGLVVISHVAAYRGDCVVVLPKYDFKWLLQSVQDYQINMLYVVPPIIIHMTNSKDVCKQYDLSSVRAAFTGAAPLGQETAKDLSEMFPQWSIVQAYGLTETSPLVCSTSPEDVWLGSSGSLLPGVTCRIVSVDEGDDGQDCEIAGCEQAGELWVKSPGLVLGYLNNQKATDETFFQDDDGSRFIKTGDKAMMKKSKYGFEHIFIVDRIKELIKVKAIQVAPAELEDHILTHPWVKDCAVIGAPSELEGEVPKAFVVRIEGGDDDDTLKASIEEYVAKHKSEHKRLKGGVEFIDAVPKSPSGKILRRFLRDRARYKERSRKRATKL